MIPIYSLYTPSHTILKERFFVPTVPKDMALRLHFYDNAGNGSIGSPSFCRAVIRKVEVILQAIDETWPAVFVWSDVDVQFFGPFTDWVARTSARYDLAFQIDAPGPALSSGFFVCRANEKTRALWRHVLESVRTPAYEGDDQRVVRDVVFQPERRLAVGYLPPVFAGGGTFTGTLWHPSQPLLVPRNLLAHHANFTCGVPNKVAQCELVQRLVSGAETIPYKAACERTGAPRLFREYPEALLLNETLRPPGF